jgi:6-phosphogluconolactonase
MTRPSSRISRRHLIAVPLLAAAGYPAAAGRPRRAPERSKPTVDKLLVYVGTYTGGTSKGIYRFQLDLTSGNASPAQLVAETVNPSFLAIHPDRRFLYAVNETANFKGTKDGSVTAFAIHPETGDLKQLNQQSSRGGGPCHIVTDRGGKHVLVANYGGGSVAVLPIRGDGQLGEATDFEQHQGKSVNPRRQEGPHGHSINLDPAGQFAFAADLGLDKVLIYRYDASKGTLDPNNPPSASVAPGSGPRHFAFHPSGRHAYVINEITSTVTAFTYDPRAGKLTPIQTLSTLPPDFTGNNSTAEVLVHPSGKFLYGSNRGHNSIAHFNIDERTGKLTPAGHHPTMGRTPRNFGIDPTGAYLLAANQESNTVVLFRIDSRTGHLEPTGHILGVPMPVCVRMMPAPG